MRADFEERVVTGAWVSVPLIVFLGLVSWTGSEYQTQTLGTDTTLMAPVYGTVILIALLIVLAAIAIALVIVSWTIGYFYHDVVERLMGLLGGDDG